MGTERLPVADVRGMFVRFDLPPQPPLIPFRSCVVNTHALPLLQTRSFGSETAPCPNFRFQTKGQVSLRVLDACSGLWMHCVLSFTPQCVSVCTL